VSSCTQYWIQIASDSSRSSYSLPHDFQLLVLPAETIFITGAQRKGT